MLVRVAFHDVCVDIWFTQLKLKLHMRINAKKKMESLTIIMFKYIYLSAVRYHVYNVHVNCITIILLCDSACNFLGHNGLSFYLLPQSRLLVHTTWHFSSSIH